MTDRPTAGALLARSESADALSPPQDGEEPVGSQDVPARPRARRLAVETAVVAGAAWAWAAVLLRVWAMPLRIPWDTRSDATLISAMVKTLEEQGTVNRQPRLGAPFGQQFYDFPHGGESLQIYAMKALVTVVGDWGLAINLYYLLGFGVLAAVTFLVLRHLRFGPVVAGIAALLYTFLPYHMLHGEMHLWRSAFFTAPLAGLLLVWTASWRERFLVEPARTGRRSVRGNLRWPRVAGAVAVAVVIASSETMTTAFTMCLLVAAAVVGAIRWREPVRLLGAAALVVVMGVTFLALSYPTLHYYQAYGTNETAARRFVTESEYYGLKVSRLITPQGGHRYGPLSDLGTRSQQDSPVPSEAGQALGILGTAGFLGALYAALAGRRRRPRGPDVRPGWDRDALREHAGLYTVLSILFGSVGGLAVIVAMAGFSQVRVWNRIVVIIAFFALLIGARWAERGAAWVRGRVRRPQPVLGVVAVAVLLFGLWDGVPIPREPYEEIEARTASDRELVARIDATLPDGAAVFQLPVIRFPEEPPQQRMVDYDHLRPYLADDGDLRWSYGSIKGRPAADWQLRVRDVYGPIGSLPGLLGLGFSGIWLDTYGYADGGVAQAAELEAELRVEPLVSMDGRFLFYDLRPFKERIALSDEQLRQLARERLLIEPPPP